MKPCICALARRFLPFRTTCESMRTDSFQPCKQYRSGAVLYQYSSLGNIQSSSGNIQSTLGNIQYPLGDIQ
jgi:hypothetical protein